MLLPLKGALAKVKFLIFLILFLCIILVSTHVLDKQIDEMLEEEGMPNGVARLVCQLFLVAGWISRRCLCRYHFLLALVYLSAEAL